MNSAGPKDPGSWNRYAYVGGDPVNRFDPSGLCWVDITRGPYWGPNTGEIPCDDRKDGGAGGGGGGDGGGHGGGGPVYLEQGGSGGGGSQTAQQIAKGYLKAAADKAIQGLNDNTDCQKLFGNDQTRKGDFDPIKFLEGLVNGSNEYASLSFSNLSPLPVDALTFPLRGCPLVRRK